MTVNRNDRRHYLFKDLSPVWSDPTPPHFPLQPKTDDWMSFHSSYVGSQISQNTVLHKVLTYTFLSITLQKLGYFPVNKIRCQTSQNFRLKTSTACQRLCSLQCKPFSEYIFSQSTESRKKTHPQICNSTLRTEMTMEFVLAGASFDKTTSFQR